MTARTRQYGHKPRRVWERGQHDISSGNNTQPDMITKRIHKTLFHAFPAHASATQLHAIPPGTNENMSYKK